MTADAATQPHPPAAVIADTLAGAIDALDREKEAADWAYAESRRALTDQLADVCAGIILDL